jgi:hypothetical protein
VTFADRIADRIAEGIGITLGAYVIIGQLHVGYFYLAPPNRTFNPIWIPGI